MFNLADLYPYQREGAAFLARTKRALLADDMGLGKTVQAIAAAHLVHGEHMKVVSCPNSLKLTWAAEIERWTGETAWVPKNKKELEAGWGQYAWTVVNHDMHRLTSKLQKSFVPCLIVDEAHRFKNRKAKMTQSLMSLCNANNIKGTEPNDLYLLTGTPVLNNVDELWSLLYMIDHTRFSSYWKFVGEYAKVFKGEWGWVVEPSLQNQERLEQDVADIVLRRDKDKVGSQIPPKTYHTVYVEPTPKQRRLIESIREDIVLLLNSGVEIPLPNLLTKVTRERQVCISPLILEDSGIEEVGPKIEAVKEIVEDTDGKVIVFSKFATAARLAASVLGKEAVVCDGSMSTGERGEAVRCFQEDSSCRALVGTIDAAGVGLTLTAASVVVFLDRDWTPAINRQAEDRAHRIGQTKNVLVIDIVMKDTVEDRVHKLLHKKNLHVKEVMEVLKNEYYVQSRD